MIQPGGLAIVNPAAGRGSGARVWERVAGVAQLHLGVLETAMTKAPGHAESLAAAWARDRPGLPVLVVGGDGTIHEVVNGLSTDGSRSALGVIPAGTGNDFARNIGLPPTAAAAVARLAGRASRPVDLLQIRFEDPSGMPRSRLVVNSTSVGVSPHANRLARRFGRMLPGRLRYALGGAAALVLHGADDYSLTEGADLVFSGPALNVTVANGRAFGGGMQISPGSRPDDGVAEQVRIGNLGRLRALVALSRLSGGTHVTMRDISVSPVRDSLRIARKSRPMLVEADGEDYDAARELLVTILPRALTVLG